MGSLDWDHHFMRTLTKLLLYESMSHMNSSTTDKWFTRSMKFDKKLLKIKPKINQRQKWNYIKCFKTDSWPFNLHLDFWKSRSWKIKVCLKLFRFCKPGFSRSPPRKKLDLYHKPEKNPGNKLKKKFCWPSLKSSLITRIIMSNGLSRPCKEIEMSYNGLFSWS